MTHHYSLYLERIDEDRNMHRYYGLSVQTTLFGEHCLIRRWGRIGGPGRQMTEFCGSEEEALQRLLLLTREKRKRDYRPKPGRPGGSQCRQG